MALTYGFYNSINHDRKYDAVQVGQLFDGLIKDGVYETYKKAMIVKESSANNQVIIQPGRAWFDHTWSYNDTDYYMNMPEPEYFLDRVDAVVLDIGALRDMRRNSFQVISGEPASDISDWASHKPALVKEEGHNQYPLCYVKRYHGQNKINAADIINTVGTSECPFVVGVIEGLSIDDLLAQWNAEFHNYLDSIESDFDEWEAEQKRKFNVWFEGEKARIAYYEEEMEAQFFQWMESEKFKYSQFLNHNTIAWNNWFSHVQTELDGDIAGHLQQQIDEIKKFASIYVVDKTLYVPMSGASVVDKKLIFARV